MHVVLHTSRRPKALDFSVPFPLAHGGYSPHPMKRPVLLAWVCVLASRVHSSYAVSAEDLAKLPAHKASPLPFPEQWPSFYIPITISDSLASPFPVWDDRTFEENARYFAYSLGVRAFSESRYESEYNIFMESLLEQLETLMRNAVPANKDEPVVVLPILVDGDAAVVIHKSRSKQVNVGHSVHRFVDSMDAEYHSVDEAKQKFVSLLTAQLDMLTKGQLVQSIVFGRASSNSPIANLNPVDKHVESEFHVYGSNVPEVAPVYATANGLLALSWIRQERRLDTFVINLLSSHYRRAFIRKQLEEEKLMKHLHYIPAVDGLRVPTDKLHAVLKDSKETLLHQGAVGCALSHITSWRDFLEDGLPYALILEDDAVILRGAKAHFLAGLDHLYARYGDDWDLLVTDYGSNKNAMGIEQYRANKIPATCYEAIKKAAETVIEISGGPCAHINSVSYIVSYRGAQKLIAAALLGLSKPIDIEMQRLVRTGVLRTFALVPFATGQKYSGDRPRSTDMVERFVTMTNGQARFTFKSKEEINCINKPCILRVFKKTPDASSATSPSLPTTPTHSPLLQRAFDTFLGGKTCAELGIQTAKGTYLVEGGTGGDAIKLMIDTASSTTIVGVSQMQTGQGEVVWVQDEHDVVYTTDESRVEAKLASKTWMQFFPPSLA